MIKFLAIFLGGGLGTLLRYTTSLFCTKIYSSFPLGTLSVNIIGSFIMGFGYFLFLEKVSVPTEIKLFLTVGFCGGLTTFSTFSLDVWNLFLGGEIVKGLLYVFLSFGLSIAALAAGVVFAKQF